MIKGFRTLSIALLLATAAVASTAASAQPGYGPGVMRDRAGYGYGPGVMRRDGDGRRYRGSGQGTMGPGNGPGMMGSRDGHYGYRGGGVARCAVRFRTFNRSTGMYAYRRGHMRRCPYL